MYDLFESETEKGFHLEFFQILNWGLFDKNVYTLNAQSKSTLLTGVNGSGKTTLVDALTTLLVPPSLRFYNQSSGSTKKKDRSEETYILGAYGNIQNENSMSTAQYLRKTDDTISILNGCFYDKSLQRYLALLQVRYFSGSELQHVFAITEARLSVEDITEILQKHGTKIDRGGKWKKLLSNETGTMFYDSFEKYRTAFSSVLGFRSDKALKLFSQIVGLKVLGNLTEFIRENMLEKSDVDSEFEKLERNYENLLQSERTILKTQKQIELLEPIVQTGKKLQEASAERERLQKFCDAVPVWKTERNIELLKKKTSELENEILNQSENQKNKKSESQNLEEAIRTLQADIDRTESSRRISQIDMELVNLGNEKERKKDESKKYEEKAGIINLPLPVNQKGFEKNLNEMKNLIEDFNAKHSELENRKTQITLEKQKNDESISTVTTELESLGKRNSNIPEKNIRIRNEICTALKCPENELPFAGELLQVKQSEEKWNAAIEKLLHNFALTILVPENHYKRVTDYVKNHDMGGRVVYLKTSENENFSFEGSHSDFRDSESVPGKMDVKQNHPLSSWISNYIEEKFNYRCTDDTAVISRAEKALTSSGFIKSGIRHEKDDRKKNGQTEFVLGWDNTQKRMSLSNQLDELKDENGKLKDSLSKTEEKLTDFSGKIFSVKSLLEITSWEKIDFVSVAKRIDALNDERKKLAASKDIKEKQTLLDQKKEEKHIVDSDYEQITKLLGNLENQMESAEKALSQNKNQWESFKTNPDFENVVQQSVNKMCDEYPRLTKADSLYFVEENSNSIIESLDSKIRSTGKSIQGYELNIVQNMQTIKNPEQKLREQFGDWSSEFSDMGATKEYLPDYENFYKRLKKDDLPKYQKQFHDFLHNSVKDDIINFNQSINNAKEDIENAVQYLNKNLRAISYNKNPDTYLSLKCERAKDGRIDEFNRKLRNAIPDAARIQMQDSAYEEELFRHIKSFLESLKENENLRNYVLDIRNWFVFAASENYVQDDAQKQYYSDSASLSGGEKAKLTYTILASAISYQFGINSDSKKSFRFVIIDEAFSKSDSTNSEYAMKLFKQLDLQVMVITPLDKINIVEDYISSVHITENKNTDDSRLLSMTIQEYRENKEKVSGSEN